MKEPMLTQVMIEPSLPHLTEGKGHKVTPSYEREAKIARRVIDFMGPLCLGTAMYIITLPLTEHQKRLSVTCLFVAPIVTVYLVGFIRTTIQWLQERKENAG